MGTVDVNALATGLWENAQAMSEANSQRTTNKYNETVAANEAAHGGQLIWAPGEDSIGPGTFVTNGQPPSEQ